MWWEILPSAGIIYVALMVPHAGYWAFNKLHNNGKNSARDWNACENYIPDYSVYLRDYRITGSEYIPRGLESIPDEAK